MRFHVTHLLRAGGGACSLCCTCIIMAQGQAGHKQGCCS